MRLTILLLGAILLLLPGCGGGGGGGVQPTIPIAIAPSTVSISPGESVQFTGVIPGVVLANKVVWTIAEGAAGGTISEFGLYTAPATAGTYHVVATGFSYKNATGTVVVVVHTVLTVAPKTGTVNVNGTIQFTGVVGGSTNQGITWSIQEGAAGGTITSTGLYTAPAAPGTFHIIGATKFDGTQDIAIIIVTAGSASGTIQ